MTYGYQQTERRTLKNTAITVARGDWEHPRVRIDLQNGLQSLSALNNKALLLKQGAAFCKNLEFQVCFGGASQTDWPSLAMTSSRGNFDALSAFPFSAFDDSNLLFLLILDRLLMNPATGFSTLPGTCIHTKWIADERTPPYPKYPKGRLGIKSKDLFETLEVCNLGVGSVGYSSVYLRERKN